MYFYCNFKKVIVTLCHFIDIHWCAWSYFETIAFRTSYQHDLKIMIIVNTYVYVIIKIIVIIINTCRITHSLNGCDNHCEDVLISKQ